MTKREKVLAGFVGLLAFAIMTVYLINRLSVALDSRDSEVTQLQQEVAKKERAIRFGNRAKLRMTEYNERSLSSDRMLARNLYESWLLQRAVDAGFLRVQVSPLPGRNQGEVYYRHVFSLSAQGDLKQVTDFLFDFYRVNLLHRIGRMNAKPIPRTRTLDLSITVEVLSLNEAPVENEFSNLAPSARLAKSHVEDYYDEIIQRNVFSPPNKQPDLPSLRSQSGERDSLITFTVKGSDPDPFDELTYALVGDYPEGARISPKTGEFRWTPEMTGELEIEIQVSDNGTPALTDTEKISIQVDEPPDEGPEFDAATQAIVTGITSVGDQRRVWVNLRTEGRVLKLGRGARLSVGSVSGVVEQIGASRVQFQTDEGKSFSVELGESLVPLDADLRGI